MEGTQDLSASFAWLQELGKVVSSRRQSLHMTRLDLAELAGMSEQNIADFEAGENNISVSLLNRIALALRTKSSLLTREVDSSLEAQSHALKRSKDA